MNYKLNYPHISKMLLCFSVIFFFLNYTIYGQDEEKIIIGHKVRIQSTILDKEIQLSIHLPDDYDSSDEQYPVLYIFQMHFDHPQQAHN